MLGLFYCRFSWFILFFEAIVYFIADFLGLYYSLKQSFILLQIFLVYIIL